jgi:hypothetical protein
MKVLQVNHEKPVRIAGIREDVKILLVSPLLHVGMCVGPLGQWYSTFFVRVPPDIISLQLCTPKVVGT